MESLSVINWEESPAYIGLVPCVNHLRLKSITFQTSVEGTILQNSQQPISSSWPRQLGMPSHTEELGIHSPNCVHWIWVESHWAGGQEIDMHMIYTPVGIAISKYIGNMVPAIVSTIIYCLFPFSWHALPKYQKYSVGNFWVMFVSSISTQLHIRMQAYFCTHDIVP